jgi:hypothetical protein
MTTSFGKVAWMMLKRVTIGLGLATVGLACSLVPAVAASASVEKSSNPLCNPTKAVTAKENKDAAAVQKAMTAGNWPAAQKALLASVAFSLSQEKSALNDLKSAPSNVQKAAATVFKFYTTTEQSAIKNSKSVSDYESKSTAAVGPKEKAAESLINAYSNKLCGPAPAAG